MAENAESTRKVIDQVPEELRDVAARKLAIFEQIKALQAENRDLRDQILRSDHLNSAAMAVAIMCW